MELAQSVPLAKVQRADFYDAIFLAGGHGAMFDLAGDQHLADLLGEAFTKGRPTCCCCL